MLEIFQYDFMQRAFIAGILIGIIAPVIGVFLVVRRYSLLADTLSHVSLVGVATSVFFHIDPLIGALVASCLAAIGIEKLRQTHAFFGESILALFLSGSLAAALVLFGLAHGLNANIFNYLFGSITTVSSHDLVIIGGCGFLVVVFTIVLFKNFFLVSYDPELAQANGLPVGFLGTLMTLFAAIAVSLSMQVVGTLLVGALMVIPVLTAIRWGTSFLRTAVYAVGVSVLAVLLGLSFSFYLNAPSGAAIVLIAIFFFVMSLVFTRKRSR